MDLSDVARRLGEVFDLDQWATWFASLDRGFLFLLILPFVIAVIGIWAHYLQDDEKDRE